MKQIKRETLKRMMDNDEDFVLIDARRHGGYDEGHLPGAIPIPADRIGEEMLKQYKKDSTIVTYCSGWDCESSTIAAKKLDKYGFVNVLDFKGGLEEWKKAGYPLDKT